MYAVQGHVSLCTSSKKLDSVIARKRESESIVFDPTAVAERECLQLPLLDFFAKVLDRRVLLDLLSLAGNDLELSQRTKHLTV